MKTPSWDLCDLCAPSREQRANQVHHAAIPARICACRFHRRKKTIAAGLNFDLRDILGDSVRRKLPYLRARPGRGIELSCEKRDIMDNCELRIKHVATLECARPLRHALGAFLNVLRSRLRLLRRCPHRCRRSVGECAGARLHKGHELGLEKVQMRVGS
jgi:hypothetical protein